MPGLVSIFNGGVSGCCPHENESCRSHILKVIVFGLSVSKQFLDVIFTRTRIEQLGLTVIRSTLDNLGTC